MYFTGFADEASDDIGGQIKALKTLGWTNMESRNIDGVNIHDMPKEKFDDVVRILKDEGISVNCFGSAIANWACSVEDRFEPTLEQVHRAVERMQILGTKLIRIMSYKVFEDRSVDEQLQDERFRRLRILQQMFSDGGITAVHENCMNYGGMGGSFTLKLIENVPGLKLVFDTGNPVFLYDRTVPKPYPKQSSWQFYRAVRSHIAYIHIKDCIYDSETDVTTYTMPGKGDGDVVKILTDLISSGYDGGISIEPHLSVVFHDESVQGSASARMDSFVEYGRAAMQIVQSIKK